MPSRQSKYLVILFLLLACAPVQARKVRLKSTPPVENRGLTRQGMEELTDSVRLSESMVLRGYEKTRDASRESLFASNLTPSTVTSITLEIQYLDMSGRQLHIRQVKIPCLIPSGETRLLDFKSWDAQHTFYYHLSPAPQRAQASPYTVRIRPVALLLKHR